MEKAEQKKNLELRITKLSNAFAALRDDLWYWNGLSVATKTSVWHLRSHSLKCSIAGDQNAHEN